VIAQGFSPSNQTLRREIRRWSNTGKRILGVISCEVRISINNEIKKSGHLRVISFEPAELTWTYLPKIGLVTYDLFSVLGEVRSLRVVV
jgi:hypothetical protein